MNQTTMIAPRGVLQSGSAGQNRSRKSLSCQVAANSRIGLTVEEAAAYTGIGRNTIRQLVGWGKIPVLKIGRKMIIRADVTALWKSTRVLTFWIRTRCAVLTKAGRSKL